MINKNTPRNLFPTHPTKFNTESVNSGIQKISEIKAPSDEETACNLDETVSSITVNFKKKRLSFHLHTTFVSSFCF